jgi:hypothetical protein
VHAVPTDVGVAIVFAPATDDAVSYRLLRDGTPVSVGPATVVGDAAVLFDAAAPLALANYLVSALDAAGNESDPVAASATLALPPSTSLFFAPTGNPDVRLCGTAAIARDDPANDDILIVGEGSGLLDLGDDVTADLGAGSVFMANFFNDGRPFNIVRMAGARCLDADGLGTHIYILGTYDRAAPPVFNFSADSVPQPATGNVGTGVFLLSLTPNLVIEETFLSITAPDLVVESGEVLVNFEGTSDSGFSEAIVALSLSSSNPQGLRVVGAQLDDAPIPAGVVSPFGFVGQLVHVMQFETRDLLPWRETLSGADTFHMARIDSGSTIYGGSGTATRLFPFEGASVDGAGGVLAINRFEDPDLVTRAVPLNAGARLWGLSGGASPRAVASAPPGSSVATTGVFGADTQFELYATQPATNPSTPTLSGALASYDRVPTVGGLDITVERVVTEGAAAWVLGSATGSLRQTNGAGLLDENAAVALLPGRAPLLIPTATAGAAAPRLVDLNPHRGVRYLIGDAPEGAIVNDGGTPRTVQGFFVLTVSP